MIKEMNFETLPTRMKRFSNVIPTILLMLLVTAISVYMLRWAWPRVGLSPYTHAFTIASILVGLSMGVFFLVVVMRINYREVVDKSELIDWVKKGTGKELDTKKLARGKYQAIESGKTYAMDTVTGSIVRIHVEDAEMTILGASSRPEPITTDLDPVTGELVKSHHTGEFDD